MYSNVTNQFAPIVAYGQSTRPAPPAQTIVEQLTRRVAELERALTASAERVATALAAWQSKQGENPFEDKRQELMQQAQQQSQAGALLSPISDEVCAFKLKHDWTVALSDHGKLIGEAEQLAFSLKGFAKQRDDLLVKARNFPTVEQEAEIRAALDKLTKREDAA